MKKKNIYRKLFENFTRKVQNTISVYKAKVTSVSIAPQLQYTLFKLVDFKSSSFQAIRRPSCESVDLAYTSFAFSRSFPLMATPRVSFGTHKGRRSSAVFLRHVVHVFHSSNLEQGSKSAVLKTLVRNKSSGAMQKR